MIQKETQLNNDKFSLWFYENCEVDVKYKTALKEIVNNCRFDEPNVKKGLIRLINIIKILWNR
jgi:hypothetical protein